MSLNWQFTDTNVFEAIPKTDEERTITDCIVWGTMQTDIGEITEKNIDEWLLRTQMLKKIGFPLANKLVDGKHEGWVPTREDLTKRIGLATNVATITRPAFRKRIVRLLEDESLRTVKFEEKERKEDKELAIKEA